MIEARRYKSQLINSLLALALGAITYFFLALAWAMYSGPNGVGNGVINWILGNTVHQGHKSSFWVLITIHDTSINIVLSLPFMYLLHRLKPRGKFLYLFLALCGYEALSWAWSANSTLEGYFAHLIKVSSSPYYIIGTYGALLISFLIIKYLYKRLNKQT